MSALFGYEEENETPQQSAIAVMDVHAKRADLPTYSELVLFIQRAHQAFYSAGDEWVWNTIAGRELLARIPK